MLLSPALWVPSEDEDARTLAEALAFLDDWVETDTTADTSSDSGSDASAVRSISKSGKNLKAKADAEEKQQQQGKKARRTTVDRRKDEIKLLRDEAEQLEARADALREQTNAQVMASHTEHRRAAIANASALVLGRTKRAALASIWKDVVSRQKKLRTASETENARLRAAVAEQRRSLASIRSLLRRHDSDDSSGRVSQLVPPNAFGHSAADDSVLLDRACDQIEAAYFAEAGPDYSKLGSGVRELSGPQIIQVSPFQIIVVFHQTWVMPFPLRDVSVALWDAVLECCQVQCPFNPQVRDDFLSRLQLHSVTNGSLLQRKSLTSQTQFRSFLMQHQAAGSSYNLCGNSAMRRREDPDRVAFMFACLSQPFEIDGAPVTGISVTNRSLAGLTRVPGAPEGADMSQIEVVHRIEIDINLGATAECLAQSKGLANAMSVTDSKQFTSVIEAVESAVLRGRPLKLYSE